MTTNETFFDNICPQVKTACIVTFSCAVFFFITTVFMICIIIRLCRNNGSLCPKNYRKYQLLDQEKADEDYAYDQQHVYQGGSSDDNYPAPSHQAGRGQPKVVIHNEFGSYETDEDKSDKQPMADQDLEARGMKTEVTNLSESEEIKSPKSNIENEDDLLGSKKEQEVDILNTQSKESKSILYDVEEEFNPRGDDSSIPVEKNGDLDAEDDRKNNSNDKLDQTCSNTDANKSVSIQYTHDNIEQETETIHQDSEVETPRDIELVSPTGSANVRIKVQVFCKEDEVSLQATEMLMSKLNESEDLVDHTFLSDLAKVDQASPLLIMCVNTSRLGTDAANAVKGIQNRENTVLLIIHHQSKHALPALSSDRLLAEIKLTGIGGIFDMAYLKDGGMYDCDMNTDCISNIQHYLRKFMVH